jgi:hypothetical protein
MHALIGTVISTVEATVLPDNVVKLLFCQGDCALFIDGGVECLAPYTLSVKLSDFTV